MTAIFKVHPHRTKHVCERTLIGITGKAGSGKDTVGCALQSEYGLGITKLSFATRLKEMVAAMLDVPYEMLEGVTELSRKWREEPFADIGKSPRELMLSLGTEWGRDMVHNDVWVRLVNDQFHNLIGGAFLTDIRFDNEAEWIKTAGGVVIETRKIGGNLQVGDPRHRSEAGISRGYIDGYVQAEHGDMAGLQSQALQLIRKLGCPSSC